MNEPHYTVAERDEESRQRVIDWLSDLSIRNGRLCLTRHRFEVLVEDEAVAHFSTSEGALFHAASLPRQYEAVVRDTKTGEIFEPDRGKPGQARVV